MALLFTRSEVLEMIADAVNACAPVTVEIGGNYLLVTKCPPVVVRKIMDMCADNTWTVSVTGGGLRIYTSQTQA